MPKDGHADGDAGSSWWLYQRISQYWKVKNSVAFSGGNGSIKDLLTPPVKGKKW